MKNNSFILSFLLLICTSVFSQKDTIRMMQYNLMYYTTSSPCGMSNAVLDERDEAFRTIIRYVQPDVFCVNELGSKIEYVERFLNNVMNADAQKYEHCPLTNYSGGSIANMLYYNMEKLKFDSHFYVTTSYRDINAYKLYYYHPQSLVQGDTTFITFIIAHLKASSGTANEAARTEQITKLMRTLEQRGQADNFIFSGDFNLYSADESAYQSLIHADNTLFQFYDPIEQEGNWSNNVAYTHIHTQSTHATQGGACYASGGLDDRFDFILVSPYIYYGAKKVRSLNHTYHALGQDGQHFNQSINASTNQLIPQYLADALYQSSDHLPVILELEISTTLSVAEQSSTSFYSTTYFHNNILDISLHVTHEDMFTFNVYAMDGRLLSSQQEKYEQGAHRIQIAFNHPTAIYILEICNSHGERNLQKIVK